jgi:hypothetical protein
MSQTMTKLNKADRASVREHYEVDHLAKKHGLLPRLAKTTRLEEREMRKDVHAFIVRMNKTGT